jgi:hypothetical protein
MNALMASANPKMTFADFMAFLAFASLVIKFMEKFVNYLFINEANAVDPQTLSTRGGVMSRKLNLIDYDLNYPRTEPGCVCCWRGECVHEAPARGFIDFYCFKASRIIASSMISCRKFSIANKITIEQI